MNAGDPIQTPLLEVRGLEKSFPGVRALTGVSFDVRPGEVARAEDLIASLEIDDLPAEALVGTLSVGNRQRVEILRALSYDARILIMDEPTAALTEADVLRLFDIVRRLKARGVGIVYISHRMDEIFMLADRVTVLRDGAFVGTRVTSETNSGELVEMMVGRRIESHCPPIDVGAKAEIHRLMGELAKAGVAILMISSELPEVLGMSDRVLVMREGRIVAEFARADATSQAVGAAMMGGSALIGRAA